MNKTIQLKDAQGNLLFPKINQNISTLIFQNNWVTNGQSSLIKTEKKVDLQLSIKNSINNNSVITILPELYRPAGSNIIFKLHINNSLTKDFRCMINTEGEVKIYDAITLPECSTGLLGCVSYLGK